MDPFINQPPIVTANFAITVSFALLSFQLVLVLLLTGIKMTGKPWGSAFGTVIEEEVRLLRLHRARYAILMALTLILLVIMYSTQAVTVLRKVVDKSTFYNVSTTCAAFWEIRNVLFSVILIAVLDSGIKVSQFRRYSSMEKAMQGGTNVNIIMMSCLVAALVVFAVACIVVFGQMDAEYLTNEPIAITMKKLLMQFDLALVRTSINAIFSIYYSIVAILMWRKRRMVPHEPKEADKNYSFRVLDISYLRNTQVQILNA